MRTLIVASLGALAVVAMHPAIAMTPDAGPLGDRGVSISKAGPAPSGMLFAQTTTNQQGQTSEPIPPSNSEAQPGQPAAPHGQAMDAQHQASRADDAAAAATEAGEKPVKQ